ncbi:hypothetical protein H6F96_24000 [Microcoleus sp. FACHB-53]|nr:hypothetical protein [Microcoleus sp. FACHB-53]MBD2126359.1 hypothetical protein [Microcoleus sp. FACHB-1]
MSSQPLAGSMLTHAPVSGWLDSGWLIVTPDRGGPNFVNIPATEAEAC